MNQPGQRCTQLHVEKYPNHIDHQGLTRVDRTWGPHAEPLELDPGHECGQVNLCLVTALHANKRSLIQPDGKPQNKKLTGELLSQNKPWTFSLISNTIILAKAIWNIQTYILVNADKQQQKPRSGVMNLNYKGRFLSFCKQCFICGGEHLIQWHLIKSYQCCQWEIIKQVCEDLPYIRIPVPEVQKDKCM